MDDRGEGSINRLTRGLLRPSKQSPVKFIGGNSANLRSFNDRSFYIGESGIDCQNCQTQTSREQFDTEQLIRKCVMEIEWYIQDRELDVKEQPILHREKHAQYLLSSLKSLPASFQSLDASGPWLCYWMTHAINLLGIDMGSDLKSQFVKYLKRCEHPDGGYGGGYLQAGHLAPTFGAVCCLIGLGTEEAYQSIDRKKLQEFLLRMHQTDGSYIMHDGGEVDVRGSYCALAVAKLTNIICPGLTANSADFIASCQTYEGGFGGLPGLEAHGGYSYCGLAALAILESEHRCDLEAMLRWLTMRQCAFEGGFNGRTCKLVDGCYSFWVGGAFPIVYKALQDSEKHAAALPTDNWIFNHRALQEYILVCCQFKRGGLIDKPGRRPDFYHTCYVLSGLSVAQHFTLSPEEPNHILGSTVNELELTDPVINIRKDRLEKGLLHFNAMSDPSVGPEPPSKE